MGRKMTVKEQKLRLTAAYQRTNDEGREVLDTVIQKLAEIRWKPGEMKQDENLIEEIKHGGVCKECGK